MSGLEKSSSVMCNVRRGLMCQAECILKYHVALVTPIHLGV